MMNLELDTKFLNDGVPKCQFGQILAIVDYAEQLAAAAEQLRCIGAPRIGYPRLTGTTAVIPGGSTRKGGITTREALFTRHNI